MTADTAAPLTPEAARRLAALLAPHLRAMRAVMADTRFTDCVTGAGPAISPATTIFMTGMLDRIAAGPRPGVLGSAEPT
ncbi:MAG TPA: hypothetical protein VH520_03080 [Streptosporangiaceae bacterium]|jgi:hypothetical protein